jgi:hypothetical protein
MKCIRLIGWGVNADAKEILRVKDSEAELKVRTKEWEYIPKNVWKLEGRVVRSSKQDETEIVEKHTKASNKKKKK